MIVQNFARLPWLVLLFALHTSLLPMTPANAFALTVEPSLSTSKSPPFSRTLSCKLHSKRFSWLLKTRAAAYAPF